MANRKEKVEPNLVAGVVRHMALPVCWCVSSQSHHKGLAGNRTARSPHRMYNFLQKKRENKKTAEVMGTKPQLVESSQLHFITTKAFLRSFQKTFGLFIVCFYVCEPLSELIRKTPGVWAPAVITQGSQDHLWLNHRSLQLIIWAHHHGLGTTMCELAASGSALTGNSP